MTIPNTRSLDPGSYDVMFTVQWKVSIFELPGTLKLTASLPLKMAGWKTTLLLGRPIFRGELLVSGRVHVAIYFVLIRPVYIFCGGGTIRPSISSTL